MDPSVRPDANDTYMKPFGASAKGAVKRDPKAKEKSLYSFSMPKKRPTTSKTKK